MVACAAKSRSPLLAALVRKKEGRPERKGLGFRVSDGLYYDRAIPPLGMYSPPLMEKQMEKNMENEMDTGGI